MTTAGSFPHDRTAVWNAFGNVVRLAGTEAGNDTVDLKLDPAIYHDAELFVVVMVVDSGSRHIGGENPTHGRCALPRDHRSVQARTNLRFHVGIERIKIAGHGVYSVF